VFWFSQRQELESDNKKLKKDLQDLRQSLSKGKGSKVASPGGQAYNVVLEQLNSTNEELEVRKEEVLILRSQLVNQEAFKHKVGCRLFSVSLPFHTIPYVEIIEIICEMIKIHFSPSLLYRNTPIQLLINAII